MFRFVFYLSFIALGCFACSSKPDVAAVKNTTIADTIIVNAVVYTVNPAQPWAEAVALADGRIIGVGSKDEMLEHRGLATRVLNLPGAMVLPGLHDSHVHPVWAGIQQAQCDLTDLATVDAVLEKIKVCATEQTGEWILGGGYLPTLFPNAAPHKDLLDEIVPGRAVYLDDADGHGAWVSSRAIELAGITAETEVGEGSVIELDPLNGEPMGTLREGAVNLVRAVTPKPTLKQRIAAAKSAQEQSHAMGLTSIIMAQSTEFFVAPVYVMAKRGDLTLNVLASLHYGGDVFDEPTPLLVAKRAQFETGRLKTHSAKIFADGVLEGGTAAMLEPYQGYGHSGSYLVQPNTLNNMVQSLDERNIQAHIHAIGDAAVRAALDAVDYARRVNGPRDNRHHIAHAAVIHPDDIPRFAELNVTANFQALWAYPDSYIMDFNLPEIGQERVDQMYPLASIASAGGRIAGGSDWSVSSLNPFWAIETGITREDATGEVKGVLNPSERVDLKTMLEAYTINTAWLMKHDDVRGSLEVGKAADITIIDRNLFDIPPKDISDTQVLYTLIDGEIVYQKP